MEVTTVSNNFRRLWAHGSNDPTFVGLSLGSQKYWPNFRRPRLGLIEVLAQLPSASLGLTEVPAQLPSATVTIDGS
jgi:hypothetical protein